MKLRFRRLPLHFNVKAWHAETSCRLVYVISKYGGEIPYLAIVKAKGEEGKRVDLGKFATFAEAQTACETFRGKKS